MEPPAAPDVPAASTDADLAAGGPPEAPIPPPSPQAAPPPWSVPAVDTTADVAETMIAPPPADAADEPTTVMPAWQPPPVVPPPPAAPPPPPTPATMEMPSRTQPPGVASAATQAELTIDSGPDAGHKHRAGDKPVRLGRSPDNDVILRDPATSGHHARLERRGDVFWVVDLGSTNGTFVNGESVQERQLNNGDRLTVGQNSVHFSLIGA